MSEDEDITELLGLEPADVAAKMAAAQAVVSGNGRKRKVRVGPLDDIHDVRHEAARLYRAIRTFDGSDPMVLIIAKDAIRALKLVLDAVRSAELEEQIVNIRRMLEGKDPLAVKRKPKRMNGIGVHA